jgi:hypothetical protein
MPRFIAALFIFIGLLAAAYVLDFVIGRPSDTLRTFVDLDHDQNLSTWFSSLLWFGSAFLSWQYATRRLTIPNKRSWLLLLLPLLFLAFSIDEVSRLHEAFGVKLDAFLLDVEREASALPATGVWIFVLGVPLIILLGVMMWALRSELADSPAAFSKILVGLVLVMTGAIGVEALSNVVTIDSGSGVLQVLVEECLEMIGATVVLWGCYELSRAPAAAPMTAK